MEPEAPPNTDKKRVRKAKWKWHESRGGKMADKLAKANENQKKKNELKKAGGTKALLKNDLILI